MSDRFKYAKNWELIAITILWSPFAIVSMLMDLGQFWHDAYSELFDRIWKRKLTA